MATPINLKWPLRKSSAGAFDTNDNTLDAVGDDLRILILTNHGERPIHYDFGANLRSLIFEFQGSILFQAVEDAINVAVEKWLPFVNILNVDVKDNTIDTTLTDHQVHIEIEFSVGNIEDSKILRQILSA